MWGLAAESDEEQRGYVPMFYPGSSDPARATVMSVRAGEEIPSVEILQSGHRRAERTLTLDFDKRLTDGVSMGYQTVF